MLNEGADKRHNRLIPFKKSACPRATEGAETSPDLGGIMHQVGRCFGPFGCQATNLFAFSLQRIARKKWEPSGVDGCPFFEPRRAMELWVCHWTS